MRYDQAGSKCSGHPQRGLMVLRQWCMDRWDLIRDLGIYNCRPVRGGRSLSLHGEGRAWDAGLSAFDPDEKQQGDELFHWAIRNAGEVGIQEVIWDRKIWTAKAEAVHAYTGQSAHRDHVHIGMTWDGARLLTFDRLHATVQEDNDLTPDQDRMLRALYAELVESKDGKVKYMVQAMNHQITQDKPDTLFGRIKKLASK